MVKRTALTFLLTTFEKKTKHLFISSSISKSTAIDSIIYHIIPTTLKIFYILLWKKLNWTQHNTTNTKLNLKKTEAFSILTFHAIFFSFGLCSAALFVTEQRWTQPQVFSTSLSNWVGRFFAADQFITLYTFFSQFRLIFFLIQRNSKMKIKLEIQRFWLVAIVTITKWIFLMTNGNASSCFRSSAFHFSGASYFYIQQMAPLCGIQNKLSFALKFDAISRTQHFLK